MIVCYDHLCFWERYGGVSRYFIELIKRMPVENVQMLVKYTNNEYIQQLPFVKTSPFLPKISFRGKARLISEVGKAFSIPSLIKGKFDIYHPTHYDTYGYRYVPKRVAIVTTIHDMNYFAIPQYYNKNQRNKKEQILSACRANHIITISENSKRDLCDYLNIPENKISVVYHGIDLKRINALSRFQIKEPYILYVGRRSLYKNFDNLIKAFASLGREYSHIKLYCAGLEFSKEELLLFSHYNVSERVKSFQVSDEQLYNLYSNAIAFVFPSFYEGFGLPILEAMANHCPVLLSDSSCFPEIASSAGLYFNPADVDDMADKIRKIINDSCLRLELICKGDVRVKEFSWERCANEHMKIYQSLL